MRARFPPLITWVISPGVTKAETGDRVEYQLSSPLPETLAWLETLTGPTVALSTIVQGTSYIDNPIQRILAAPEGQKIDVSPTSVTIYGSTCSSGPHKADFKALDIAYNPSLSLIDIYL